MGFNSGFKGLMDSFIMAPHFGAELVAFEVVINSRLNFRYRPQEISVLICSFVVVEFDSFWGGVCGRGDHSPVIIPVPTATCFPVYADILHTLLLTGSEAIYLHYVMMFMDPCIII